MCISEVQATCSRSASTFDAHDIATNHCQSFRHEGTEPHIVHETAQATSTAACSIYLVVTQRVALEVRVIASP